MRRLGKNSVVLALFLSVLMQTGCQSTSNAQSGINATATVLPDFSPERAEREAAYFDPLKSKPDFTQIDVVTIVPAGDQ
ncbi:hypothetical protein [Cerasicoccus arenae]|uniref:Uncharacterized protein n=1 Tax=Cerasicoccus arenae TaxID=424488 RepID=A0A8J3GBW1_9BACT|nr:hypothetical protein [Cerasicoccus arenae]MBK1859797.1 hypothetical protein [Cerasicoccus arenae]GHB93752.1 hypothetical protein GCM10007047_06590 [Cerasicoccus arenae]